MARRKQPLRHKKHKHPTKELSDDQEFRLMAMVLDKFLWIGTGFVGLGMYFMITNADIYSGVPYVGAGLGIMIVFGLVIVRYFEGYS